MKSKFSVHFRFSLLLAIFAAAFLTLCPRGAAQNSLTNGLVAHWPLDVVNADNTTPDTGPGGYDLTLFNFSSTYVTNGLISTNGVTNPLVPVGTLSNAFVFNGAGILYHIDQPGDALPIWGQQSFTISMWENFPYGTNNSGADGRLFSEANNSGNNNPLFNIESPNSGFFGSAFPTANGATAPLALFLRRFGVAGQTDLNPNATIRWISVTNDTLLLEGSQAGINSGVFDYTWHYITVTKDTNGFLTMYVDGVSNEVVAIDQVSEPNPITAPAGPLPQTNNVGGPWTTGANDTTIGGIIRGNFGTIGSQPSSGTMIDDVACWNRVLTPAEIMSAMTNGIPVVPGVGIFQVNLFSADMHAVASGDKVQLNWAVKNATNIVISPTVGNVTAQSVFGAGSTDVTLTSDTTFTLTATHNGTNLTSQLTVRVQPGVAANWRLLEQFDFLTNGWIDGQGPQGGVQQVGWQDPNLDINFGNLALGDVTSELNYKPAATNQVLSFQGQNGNLGELQLNSLAIPQGQSNTLFFRFYVSALDTNDFHINLGLTDRGPRTMDDGFTTVAGPNDVGPSLHLVRVNGGLGGTFDLQADNGIGDPLSYSYMTYVDPAGLQTGQVYNVWMDIQKLPFTNTDGSTLGDNYQIYLQREGDSTRTNITAQFAPNGLTSDRSVSTVSLANLFICAYPDIQPSAGGVRFDDFYLSANGFNSTKPVPTSFFSPQLFVVPNSAYDANAQIFTLTWASDLAATYTVQKKAHLTDPTWTTVVTGYPAGGATNSTTTYIDTTATDANAFYRITQP
jgi:hypothetical protein